MQLINIRETKKILIARTDDIVVGNTYFLSDFYDQSGTLVRVLSKSTKKNNAGWPSSVEVEIVERINLNGQFNEKYYAIGTKHIVNACNLYVNRKDASAEVRFSQF